MAWPVIVLGAGGHAKVLIDILKLKAIDIIGITIRNKQDMDDYFCGIKLLGTDDEVLHYPPEKVLLVNGIGSILSTLNRKELFIHLKNKGYHFETVIHPSAIISSDVILSEGVQIMAGAILQPGTVIGSNTIINTKASIDHDCHIGEHVHIAPGVTISGGVQVDNGVHIGTGAAIIQGIRIGTNSLIGAGAVVINNITDHVTALGVPAKEVEKNVSKPNQP